MSFESSPNLKSYIKNGNYFVTRILIVDDEKDNLQALTRLLRGQYDVVTTTSPFDALKLVQKEIFSVIISDQRMPEMKGVELLEKIKNISPHTTRILLTGYTEIESIIDAINRGHVYRYVAKPWDPDDLKQTVRQAEEASRLRREVEDKNVALQTALVEIKRLDQAKHRFLSLVSHELNTPLTVITSFLTLLGEKQSQLGDDGRKAFGAIAKATQRLSDIIGEVLTYIRMDVDGELSLKEGDLRALVTSALRETDSERDKKSVKLNVVLPASPVMLRLDASKLALAFSRLFQETLRHAPNGSSMKVSLKELPDAVELEVWRTGGVLDLQAFEPLELSGSIMNHQQNMGLGLALGKMIIEAHGGNLRLDSDPAKGTSVYYWLPRQPK